MNKNTLVYTLVIGGIGALAFGSLYAFNKPVQQTTNNAFNGEMINRPYNQQEGYFNGGKKRSKKYYKKNKKTLKSISAA